MSDKGEMKENYWANSITGKIIRNAKDDLERYYPQDVADELYSTLIAELDSLMTKEGEKVLYHCIETELDFKEFRQRMQLNQKTMGLVT